jgi:hypothetical protein
MARVSQYRDPLAGLRSQIATKRGLLESRERSLPALLRSMLPSELRRLLDDLGSKADAGLPDEPSIEQLTQADAALDELLRLHDEAAELVPKLRSCPDEVPDPPKPQLSPPWVYEEQGQLRFRATLTRRLAEIAPDAYFVRWDDTTYLSRFPLAGAPLVVTARYEMIPGQLTSFRSAVRTSVPESVPPLDVRRARVIDGVGRAVGLVHDAKVGEPVFDHAFIVDDEGGPAAIRLLTSDVSSALLGMTSRARLHVRRGIAELTWQGRWPYFDRPGVGDALLPDEAFAIVLGVRAAIERA